MSLPSLLGDPLLRHVSVHQGFKVLPPVVMLERLGEGAFGSVYRGHHLNLHIEVAVKCLKSELVLQKAEYAERFEREARIAASCTQENLVRVYDTLQAAGLYYTVMEFVDGENLEGRVKRRGAMSAQEALTVFTASAKALRALHARQVFHRDVKPPNILISRDGAVKLADLGIAKSGEQVDSLVTAPGTVMGTPRYMAPEQFENADQVGEKTDFYSLGATLGYMLVGRHIIGGEGLHEILNNVCRHGFPDIGKMAESVPPGVCELVRDCTALKMSDRPTGAELLRRATRLLHELGGEALLEDPDAGQSYGTSSGSTQIDRSQLKEIRRAMTTIPTSTGSGSSEPDSLALTSFAAMTHPGMGATVAPKPDPAMRSAAQQTGPHETAVWSPPSAAATRHIEPVPTPPPPKHAAPVTVAPRRKRRRWPWVMLVFLLLIGAVAAAIVLQEPRLKTWLTQLTTGRSAADPSTRPASNPDGQTLPIVPDNTPTTNTAPVDQPSTSRPLVGVQPSVTDHPEGEHESTVRFVIYLDVASTRPVTVIWGTVDQPPANASVAWAKPNVDYTPITSQAVQFDPGQTEANAWVRVLGNDRDDPDRLLAITIHSVDNAEIAPDRGRAAVMIRDDDEPVIVVTAEMIADEVRAAAGQANWAVVMDKLVELLGHTPDRMPRAAYVELADEVLTAFRVAWPDREARREAFPEMAEALNRIADTGDSSVAALLWIEARLLYDANDQMLLGRSDPTLVPMFEQAMIFAGKAIGSTNPQSSAFRYLADIYLMHETLGDTEQAYPLYYRGIDAGDSESAGRIGRQLLSGAKSIDDALVAINHLRSAADEMTPPSGYAAYWYAAALAGNPSLAAAVADRYEGQTLEDYCKSYYIKSARLGYAPAKALCDQRGYDYTNPSV